MKRQQTLVSWADGTHQGGIHSPKSEASKQSDTGEPATHAASFDIVHTKITTSGQIATFHMAVSGQAGESKPAASGKLASSDVFSYVWPTTLNSYDVGFEESAGILAMAVTAHPDFDDTPLFDENQDQDPNNDGDIWHSHWVVLQPNDECGPGALGVVGIANGVQPRLPKTWP